MSSIFPIDLDIFQNPTAITVLNVSNSLKHSVQHENINDSMVAVQSYIGISGSNIPGTITYILNNPNYGHDHNGINSTPIKIGPTGSSLPYSEGLFNFNQFTIIGDAISELNVGLKNISSSFNTGSLEFQFQNIKLSDNVNIVNFSGTGVNCITSSNKVTYEIPGFDWKYAMLFGSNGPIEKLSNVQYYKENIFGGNNNRILSSSIWYLDNTKNVKLFEIEYANRNNKNQSEKIIYNIYEDDGVNLKTKIIDIITYNNIYELSRIRTVI